MKRRSKPSGKPLKALPRKALKLKGRKASKAVTRRGSAPAGQETELARLTRELNEALEQRAAITDILREISNSRGDVQPVLGSVAERAAYICGANVVEIAIADNEVFRLVASFGEAEAVERRIDTARPLHGDRPRHLRSATDPRRRPTERRRRVPSGA